MGWDCIINSNKEITESEIDSILELAPDELKSKMGASKQSWGWHMATDVSIEGPQSLCISGSWSLSGEKAEPMRAFLRKQLKLRGHKIRSTRPS